MHKRETIQTRPRHQVLGRTRSQLAYLGPLLYWVGFIWAAPIIRASPVDHFKSGFIFLIDPVEAPNKPNLTSRKRLNPSASVLTVERTKEMKKEETVLKLLSTLNRKHKKAYFTK